MVCLSEGTCTLEKNRHCEVVGYRSRWLMCWSDLLWFYRCFWLVVLLITERKSLKPTVIVQLSVFPFNSIFAKHGGELWSQKFMVLDNKAGAQASWGFLLELYIYFCPMIFNSYRHLIVSSSFLKKTFFLVCLLLRCLGPYHLIEGLLYLDLCLPHLSMFCFSSLFLFLYSQLSAFFCTV